ncbi:MAG: glycosyltransferase [Bacteroidota bacterium]
MRNLSVIIVTYKSLNIIDDCLTSILKYNDIGNELEIIIVDNSPLDDPLFNYITNHYQEIKIIKNNNNGGYGQGNNLGISKSEGEIICIMNPDVRLSEPIFSKTLFEFKNNNKLGMLGYKQLGGCNLSFYLKPEYNFPVLSSIIIKITNKLNYFNQKFFYLSGAFIFINKNKFDEIGGFDENIFLYFEEPDITNRFTEKKHEIMFNKKHPYLHLIEDRDVWSESTFKEWLTSLRYYLRKFQLNEKTYFKGMKIEYILKLFLLRINHNKIKEEKIKNEYAYFNLLLKEI